MRCDYRKKIKYGRIIFVANLLVPEKQFTKHAKQETEIRVIKLSQQTSPTYKISALKYDKITLRQNTDLKAKSANLIH